jgi:hypothetical protein
MLGAQFDRKTNRRLGDYMLAFVGLIFPISWTMI